MSAGYNSGLSEYPNKGSLNLKENEESEEEIERKVDKLSGLIKEAKHIVFHTGAGISTSTVRVQIYQYKIHFVKFYLDLWKGLD